MAYSTVSQVGYLFMVVAVAARSDLAVPALAVYLAGYAVTNIGAFAAIAAAPIARSIADWATAIGRNRWIVVSLVVCLLGLVGTPPTVVFVGRVLQPSGVRKVSTEPRSTISGPSAALKSAP